MDCGKDGQSLMDPELQCTDPDTATDIRVSCSCYVGASSCLQPVGFTIHVEILS
jgi:hypothetical protein